MKKMGFPEDAVALLLLIMLTGTNWNHVVTLDRNGFLLNKALGEKQQNIYLRSLGDHIAYDMFSTRKFWRKLPITISLYMCG